MMIRKLHIFILIITTYSCQAQDIDYRNYSENLSDLFNSLNLDSGNITILIDKTDNKLSILKDTAVIKEYPVVFGGNSYDDKLMQGDGCTPEGTFYIISKYPHKKWSKFIWIDYPNDDSRKKHNKAKEEGKIPKDANIGGQIGIHGVPKGMNKLIDLGYNWTLGCISLKNEDVDEIYPYITEKTKIIIQK